jgi:hypothetical protein
MDPVTIRSVGGEDRQLTITLPAGFPIGPVLVTITPVPDIPAIVPGAELTRDQARALMAAAGVLSMMRYAPPGAKPLSDAEREEFGRLEPGSSSILQLVSEDRGAR